MCILILLQTTLSVGDAKFGLQVSFGFVGRVVTAVVAFGGSIVLARVLGPEKYGVFYFLMATVQFLDNPVTGWADGCRKRLTEENFPSSEAIGSLLIGLTIFLLIVALLSRLGNPLIAEYTGLENGWTYLSFLFLGVATFKTTNEVLKSTKRFGSSTWLEAARDIVRVLTQISLVLLGWGIAGMVGGMVLANLLLAPVVLFLIGSGPQFQKVTQ